MLASGFSGISITQFHIRGAPSSSVICRLYNYIFSVVSEILDGQWRFLYGATFVTPYNWREKTSDLRAFDTALSQIYHSLSVVLLDRKPACVTNHY